MKDFSQASSPGNILDGRDPVNQLRTTKMEDFLEKNIQLPGILNISEQTYSSKLPFQPALVMFFWREKIPSKN